MTKPLHVLLIFCLCFAEIFGAHAIALFGTPKYPRDFSHFDYVNPNAPKGGTLKSFELGTFDSLNPFVQKGNAAQSILALVYETLGVGSLDESATEYGLIAQEFILDPKGFFLECHINPKATFSDGIRISAEDVKFSFETLMTLGKIEYRRYYADVERVEVLDSHKVRFYFKTNKNTELPLILSQLPILPKHIFVTQQGNTFGQNPLDLPIGSGPYVVDSYDLGRKIILKANPNYWAKNHPTRKGFFNFENLEIEYYKDPVVAQQAFMAGAYNWRIESSAKVWAKDYNTPKQALQKIVIPNNLPSTLQGFFFNTKRQVFANVLVREAIFYAFDFEWSNQNLFFGQYERTINIFDNSIFASSGIPMGEEKRILQKLPLTDSRILTQKYLIPRTDHKLPPRIESGWKDWRGITHIDNAAIFAQDKRENLKYAASLLAQAGFRFKNGVLVDTDDMPLRFEIMINYEGFERICLPFIQNLQKLGIQATLAKVDDTQYTNRLRNFDYDMVIGLVGQSLNPGNEQRFYWGSEAANNSGGRNYARIDDSNIDFLIEQLIKAKDSKEKIAYGKALDRILLWGFYMIPHFHAKGYRIAYWNDTIAMPDTQPLYGFDPYVWWAK
ncbi:extracellular solute-binding protein [Helicobacter equorum]|uniref:extracellular solute-binding protein n=1 Tax=Helicobacter equorum TaxID=361872 RepID=UPI000CF0948E|nr:extracellular solute-binding protein [Helicobacter equorum]